MKYLLTFVWLFLLLSASVYGQEKVYPKALKPSESFTAVDSTFVVLTEKQFDNAIINAMKVLKADSLIKSHELTRVKLDSIITLKDSTIFDYRTGYDRYRIKWEGVHEELEEAEVKILKLRRWTLFSGVLGVGAGVLLGVLVF